MIETKICTRCKEELTLLCFHMRKSKSGKMRPREHCKECRSALAKSYHENKDKQQHTLNSIKARSVKIGVPFDLSYEDINSPDMCPVLGIKLERYSGGAKPNSPSVDRIIPELGYVKGNVQIISLKANMMKHDATPEELERFAKWILKQKS